MQTRVTAYDGIWWHYNICWHCSRLGSAARLWVKHVSSHCQNYANMFFLFSTSTRSAEIAGVENAARQKCKGGKCSGGKKRRKNIWQNRVYVAWANLQSYGQMDSLRTIISTCILSASRGIKVRHPNLFSFWAISSAHFNTLPFLQSSTEIRLLFTILHNYYILFVVHHHFVLSC